MSGPPIEIHVDPDAPPRAVHTPAIVPLHWQEKAKADLLRNEALGVIERESPMETCYLVSSHGGNTKT